MKKIILLMIFLIFSMLIISGCSSDRPDFGDRQFGRGANITEEEMQKMIEQRQGMSEDRPGMTEEMQQGFLDACQEKREGDSCTIESPRGETKGVCKMMDENLVCTMERPEEPMRQGTE